MSILKDKVLGEGPRSGGGEVLSGAVAQRKEGEHPPGYLISQFGGVL